MIKNQLKNLSKNTFKVGLVQMTSSDNIAQNIIDAEDHIRSAAAIGAEFVLTPEMTPLLDFDAIRLMEKIKSEQEDTTWRHFARLAEELGIWLLLGSAPIKCDDKAANRSYLFSPQGEKITTYDKIHMFDVDLPDQKSFRESKTYKAGDKMVIADLPWGKLGLTICYDLRFPYLYRRLAQAGSSMISVPSAFTKLTGEAHWRTLLRARAIENGVYIFAPAQVGNHVNGRETFGHSLIIDPWGITLGDGGNKVGVTIAEIDIQKVKEARMRIGSLSHDRDINLS